MYTVGIAKMDISSLIHTKFFLTLIFSLAVYTTREDSNFYLFKMAEGRKLEVENEEFPENKLESVDEEDHRNANANKSAKSVSNGTRAGKHLVNVRRDWEVISVSQCRVEKPGLEALNPDTQIGTKSVKQCIQFYYLWKKVCPDEYRRLRIIQRKKRQCTIDQLSTNQGSQLLLGDTMDDEDATAEMILFGLSGALSDQSHRAPGSAQIEDKHNPLASDGDLVSSTSSDNRLFVCEYSECSASFNSRAALNGHIRIHGGGMGRTGGVGGGGGGNSPTPERLRPTANASSNASTYNATTLSETLEEFPCKICGKVFSKVKSRSAHMKSHRPPDAEPKKPKLEVSSPKMDCPSPLQSGLLRPPTPSSGMRGPSIGGTPHERRQWQ